MTNYNKEQGGFTLVELVVVIVLLGILAVVAVPRFIDLQSDAKAAVLQGIKGSIQGASTQIYAKALIQGVTSGNNQAGNTVTSNLGNIAVAFGYPTAAAVPGLLAIDSADIFADPTIDGAAPAAQSVHIGYDSTNSGTFIQGTDADCYVTYTEAAALGGTPTVVITGGGC